MAVSVNKFKVRHNGVDYGPGQEAGQVINDLTREQQDRLVAGSNGTIVLVESELTTKKQSKTKSLSGSNPQSESSEEPNAQKDELPPDTNIDDLIKQPETNKASA